MNYYCRFCDQRCKKAHGDSPWWHCEKCKVFFKEDESEIVFRPNSETHLYWLMLKLHDNKTVVESLRNPKSMNPEEVDPMSLPKVLVSVPYIMQGVTPQNMYEKLRTLLVFS